MTLRVPGLTQDGLQANIVWLVSMEANLNVSVLSLPCKEVKAGTNSTISERISRKRNTFNSINQEQVRKTRRQAPRYRKVTGCQYRQVKYT